MRLHEDKELFEQVLTLTADNMKIDAAIVEKDYFVTMLLQEIARRQPTIIFKGGTSLSKCYKLINRFSEDIDLNVEVEKPTDSVRKRLKECVVSSIDTLEFTLTNPESILTRRDFNRYVVDFPTIFSSDALKQHLVIETAMHIRAFPTVVMPVASYIYDYLCSVEGGGRIIIHYALQPYELKVLTMERTFIDKTFALGDYYLDGKIAEHSRHIYDLYKLLPLISLDDDFKRLVREVRNVRRPHRTCLSAQEGVNAQELLERIITEDVYKSDYKKITLALLFEAVDYDTAINALKAVVESGAFIE
ncbi:MAG: nucleotidyl transferase AbiEii/AbiGii toxin family protein [Bacillota bacterium]|jgi:predicted nucleotidyltransferase component of viral defense system